MSVLEMTGGYFTIWSGSFAIWKVSFDVCVGAEEETGENPEGDDDIELDYTVFSADCGMPAQDLMQVTMSNSTKCRI